MRKFLLIIISGLVMTVSQAIAQERTVTGKVTSTEDGSPLPGVNVVIKGTAMGTVTDAQGGYSLRIPSEEVTVVYSFVGYETQEVQVNGRSVIDLKLMYSSKQLSEVIVTANAIEREKKEIGYAVSTVGSEEITKARETNLVNALAGKVPGVVVSSQSGTAGGSTRILIRGANSFEGSNQPLFVVDGVPVSNQNFSGTTRNDLNGLTTNDRINGGFDTGNRAADINADDIASISVLKGAAATALYGSRAKDGAIIITTKRGSNKSKSFVTINSSYRFDTPLRLPDFQNEFAPGNFGKYDLQGSGGWGPRLSTVSDSRFLDWKGDSVFLQAYPDNVRDFYETGRTVVNSVALAGGNEVTDYRISYTQVDQSGIVPNNTLKRNTLALNAGTKLPNNFSSRIGINYVKTTSIGRPAQGGNDANVLSTIVNFLPRTTNIGDLKNYKEEDGTQREIDQFTNNPYWVAHENVFTGDVERIYGFAQLGFDPAPWINITGRVGTDFFAESRNIVRRKGTIGALNGQFRQQELFNRELNADLISTITKSISPNLNFTGIVGFNVNQRSARSIANLSQNLTIDQLYNFANAESNSPTNFTQMQRIYGVYADLGLGFKDYLFLNITGRNDWSSTLPPQNNSYFYPSISSSFIFTQALGISNNVLSYGKLRANIAQVGSDELPYALAFTYSPLTSYYVQFLPDNTYPINGSILAFAGPNVIPPRDLKPQRQTSWEIGTELQLFNGRIGVDFTYYNTVTSDQIVSIPIPESTGYALRRENVGEISNKGIELLLTGTPLSLSNGFKWDVSFNFGRNRQRVEKLTEGLQEYNLTGGFNGMQIKAVPGEQLGLYGTGWTRDAASGEVVIDGNTGLRIPGDIVKLGNIYPNWTLGIQNTFSYKGVMLSALIDWRQGGVLYSATVNSLRFSGMVEETTANRDGSFIDKGVIRNLDGTTRTNDVPVTSMEAFWQNYSRNTLAESGTFDASYIKLREVRLSYQLPKSLMQNLPFGLVEVGIEGRNLALLKSEIPHIDPEVGTFGAGITGEGIEAGGFIPTTRSLGFNVRLTF